MSITGDEVSESEKRLRSLEQGLREANEKIGRLEGAQKAIDGRVIQAIKDMKPVSNETIIAAIIDARRQGILK